MTDYTDLSLKNFFIYNVLYGQKEGEEEKKIMFFYPKDTNIDLQIKDVGLSEAIVKFSETFSSETCDALQTEKTRRLFFQPEKNFWMVLSAAHFFQTINVPTNKKGKDGLDGIEYRGGEIQNTVYSAVLRQSYFMAKLFIGPFMQLVESQEGDTELLRRRLDKFFSLYLSTLRLKNCDILDVFQGVRFLPLDKTIFLHAQCFVNVIEASFPVIDYSVFLYEDELIW
ncbi:hypothetical protein AAG570_010294 [Ranatra chinensis]|uniref:CCZ1/INTU/HSP4 first Longin domain-containing protein n=1 Tax=Ranatra chinensis TaxID=642074 RepID=A0ABD0Z890_9HEMI